VEVRFQIHLAKRFEISITIHHALEKIPSLLPPHPPDQFYKYIKVKKTNQLQFTN